MRVLGRQRLAQISTSIGYQGDLRTLASHLDSDDDLGVEPATNRLIFQCAGLIANASAAEFAASRAAVNEVAAAAAGRRAQLPAQGPQAFPASLVAGTPDPTGLTAAEAFSLSSRPGSRYKLVLDFDGNRLVGGTWNMAKGLQEIVAPPYDKDGNPGSFNADEIADIVAIWHAVAEDYAAWDVDVTTIDPGDAALAGVGQKVLIGGHSGDWYGSAGGVAFVSSFGQVGMPCFVFPRNLGPNYAKFVWEAVSHEFGHTLGLFHDGLVPNPEPEALYPDGTSYYSGQGNWAPIMGVGYYKEVTQFDAGEYPYSNNKQNDMNIISQVLPRLPQQYGSALNAATPLVPETGAATAGTATAVVNGILSATNQADWFSLSAAAGSATIAVAVTAPFGQGRVTRANLNAVATVFDASGAVLATLNPAGMEVPTSTVNIPSSGTYYVSVSGAGEGTPTTGGYSSYASLGFYSLTVKYQASAPPPPVDCVGYWSSYSTCDASCTQVSTYVITQVAANGGAQCPTAAGVTRSLNCSDGACVKPAVDCVGYWSSYSTCDASCTQISTYIITQVAANGGAQCPTAAGVTRSINCSDGACVKPAVDCVGAWSDWSLCSSNCTQVSTYVITQVAANGGAQCPTAAGVTRSINCSDGACVKPAVDCVGAWSDWSQCSSNCTQVSNYVITQRAANGGAECPAQDGMVRQQACQGGACKPPAPVDTRMVVTAIRITREVFTVPGTANKTGRGVVQPREVFQCKAVVTVRTTAGVALPKARVYGTWSAPDNANFTAAAAPADTRPSGQAVLRSKATWVQGAGKACVFKVDNVEYVGRSLDVTKSVVTSSYSWR